MSTPPDQLDEASVSDAELIAAARSGDAGALGVLYGRHAEAARAVAARYTNSAADADDVVSESFAAVMGALQRGNGPTEAFRAYLFTVVRRVASTRRDAGRREQPTDDLAALESGTAWAGSAEDPALAGFERGVVARAFHSLPERWQAVLWHTEVDGLNPAQIAPILGISANSVAALAYRAREGLRQAYLQQHLGDPLEPGCRAFAGKLGSYVRGGLGTRETAAVERHLDECGECRGLVLELGDVNHGMRAVVAPLVLGVAGLGAIAGLAPVAAGLGAGAVAASGAGSGTGGGAAGGGAAAGAGLTTGAVSTVGAGAGATAGASGIAAFVASIPPAVAALVAGGVVVAGIATAAIIANRDGEPTVVAPSVTSSATPGPTATAGTPAPSASVPPTVPPTAPPTTAPTADPGTVPPLPPAPPAGPGDQPTVPPTAAPPPPTDGPTTPPTDPPPAPPAVAVVLPDGGLSLDAGVAGQELRFAVQNAGGSPAAGLEASVTLPEGVELDAISVPDLLGGPGFSVVAAAATWSCDRLEGSATAARCTLDELPAGASAELLLRVTVPESYDRTDGTVHVRVAGGGLDFRSDPIPVRVQPAPARLAVASAPDAVSLVAGRSRPFSVDLVNAGGRSSAVSATVHLPAGVRGGAATGSPWACVAGDEDDTLTCSLDGLGPHRTSTLALDLRAAGTDVEGVVRLELSPSGRGAPGTATVPVVVRAPATLALTGPSADVHVAGGRPSAVALAVRNTGGVRSEAVTLRLERTSAVRWGEDPVPGWRCDDAGATLTCTGPALDPDERVEASVALDGVPGEFGEQSLRASATAADAEPSERLGVPFDVARPSLAVTATLQLAADGQGMLEARSSVSGADAAGATVTVTLPANLVWNPGAVEEVCEATERTARRVVCDLGTLAADADRSVLLSVRATSAGQRTASVALGAAGARDAAGSATARTTSAGLSPRVSVPGASVRQAGAPLLSCAPSRACSTVLGGSGDNNGRTMVALDEAADPPTGVRPAVPVSSSTHLSIPGGRDVAWAGLYWSANRSPATDGWSNDLTTATVRGPGGAWTTVSAAPSDVTTVKDNAGREYYQSFADVTSLVQAHRGGTWSVADTAVSDVRRGGNPSYYAGWALVVVYADSADRTATVYDGGAWVAARQAPPVFRFAADPGTEVRAGVVAWEGDRNGTGDRLTLGSSCSPETTDLTPLRWNGSAQVSGGSSSNAFDSTATGWRASNALGVDVKAFAAASLDCEVGSLTPTTQSDQYLVGAVTLMASPPAATTTSSPTARPTP